MMKEQEILERLGQDQAIREILEIIRSLELKDSWLAAGSVRNFIWNILSGKPGFDAETDVDVIFFDPTVSYEKTLQLEMELRKAFPAYSWELKNQVYMHIHSPNSQPYTSSKDAMSKYPECCTAIGLRLLEDDKLELFAPYGLADIRAFQVRPTPHFLADAERKKLYMERLSMKNWQAKWPQLSFESLSEEK
ncbi:nucleotidyltransferase family protein [Streptococcus cristatus]|uniref:Nucleotidyltransferase family protein n=1 Tax=Streptococcus cristatus TaxID=45634 RepID=A0A5B0DA60_STRCR|nr:nucleotidyltransferase family protein [Streptococcus cristatus]KAA0963458.1 nucleotidyltransferase family protein [Streptococcus cristatus]